MRPRAKSYGDSSTVTLSPTNSWILRVMSLPLTRQRQLCPSGCSNSTLKNPLPLSLVIVPLASMTFALLLIADAEICVDRPLKSEDPESYTNAA